MIWDHEDDRDDLDAPGDADNPDKLNDRQIRHRYGTDTAQIRHIRHRREPFNSRAAATSPPNPALPSPLSLLKVRHWDLDLSAIHGSLRGEHREPLLQDGLRLGRRPPLRVERFDPPCRGLGLFQRLIYFNSTQLNSPPTAGGGTSCKSLTVNLKLP